MGFNNDTISSPTLVLGLGFPTTCDTSPTKKPTTVLFEPSLTLGFSDDKTYNNKVAKEKDVSQDDHDDANPMAGDLYRQDSAGEISTLSNASVKKEREFGGDDDIDGSNGRKKLRLTKAQSAFLEQSFKYHTTPNPNRKQELARELNLRPRQVEVWFQNRRARTKLKQTEVDCDYLKKCCETLKDENRRLYKELQHLRALTFAQPFYRQFPAAATLTMCPSCERIAGVGENGSKNSPFTMP